MPFTKEVTLDKPYVPGPSPVLGNDKAFMENELREISKAIRHLEDAVKEIQDYLETLP